MGELSGLTNPHILTYEHDNVINNLVTLVLKVLDYQLAKLPIWRNGNLVFSSLELVLVSCLLVPGDLINPVGLVIVPDDDNGSQHRFLNIRMEAWTSLGLLKDLSMWPVRGFNHK